MGDRGVSRLMGFIACILASVLAAPQANARLIEYTDFQSVHVLARNITVWVPDDYDPIGQRLPVIYMHDGQNLFQPERAYGGKEWGVDEALIMMKRRVIIVGVWNTKFRGREYFPQKLFNRLPSDQQDNATTTHGGAPLSDDYLRFLVTELKPFIDRNFRTRVGPKDTSIMGSSMGGLISLYAIAEYPQIFGQAASLSMHWPLADPRKGDPVSVAEGFYKYLKNSKIKPGRNRIYMDHGTLNLDSLYRPYSERVEAFMPSLGWQRDKNWISRIFPETDHNETSWRARINIPLSFLLGNP
jgi:Putative esterase